MKNARSVASWSEKLFPFFFLNKNRKIYVRMKIITNNLYSLIKTSVFVHSDSASLVCFFDIAEHSWALSHNSIMYKFSPETQQIFAFKLTKKINNFPSLDIHLSHTNLTAKKKSKVLLCNGTEILGSWHVRNVECGNFLTPKRVSGKWVPAIGRTDWFHYMLLRQAQHLCVEARHAVVNKWELPLARRAAGVAWSGSKPCGLIFIIPQKRSFIPCCLLAVVLDLHQPWAMPRTCQGKMRHLAEVKTVLRTRQQCPSNWGIAGWSISLSWFCFPFQSRLQSYVPSLILSCTCTIRLIAKL